MAVASVAALLALGVQGNHIINSQNRNGSLSGETQRLYFGDGGLDDASGQVVSHLAVHQVEAHEAEVLLALDSL